MLVHWLTSSFYWLNEEESPIKYVLRLPIHCCELHRNLGIECRTDDFSASLSCEDELQATACMCLILLRRALPGLFACAVVVI